MNLNLEFKPLEFPLRYWNPRKEIGIWNLNYWNFLKDIGI